MALPLLLLLAGLASEPPLDPSVDRHEAVPAVHGGFAAPGAWLVLWHGEAWVCWDASTGDCWQRLELAGLVDLATLRAEFVDRSTLALTDRSDGSWQVVRPDPTPRIVRWSTTARHSPQVLGCGPSGVLPIARAGGPGLLACDAPAGDTQCVRPGRPLRLRPASPIRLRIGLELRALDDWRALAGLAAATGVQVLATIGVGLDAGWSQQRRERADLQAQARPSPRTLPAPRSRGPLIAGERQALHAVICGGAT